jgi:hypothetical protein
MDQEELVLVGMVVKRDSPLNLASLKYWPFALAMTRGEKNSVMALNSSATFDMAGPPSLDIWRESRSVLNVCAALFGKQRV